MAIGARKKPSLAKGIAETLGVQELCIAVGAATYWSTTALLCIAWNGGHAAAGPASFLEQGFVPCGRMCGYWRGVCSERKDA